MNKINDNIVDIKYQHYKVQDGVYCTEYNNSIIIYFNYNDTAVTVNSLTVEPKSAMRVN